eukprot:TRINITY_DN13070_c0_g1_i1.p1 TRINITY_DN13070_c0_g1~~TRINITY_DN13070_c0_g1_i1.p1  ORF type:complete len:370 (+),score=76.66 TRINITY_DN13070_c0_g1_i1:299-1408(+)
MYVCNFSPAASACVRVSPVDIRRLSPAGISRQLPRAREVDSLLVKSGRQGVRLHRPGKWFLQQSSGRAHSRRRRAGLVSAVQGSGGLEATSPEKALKTTVELDRFIDKLRATDSSELPLAVTENVLAFDRMFWLRLAARADTCQGEDDKKDFEELASSIMSLVEKIVKKTDESIGTKTDILSDLLKCLADSDGQIRWPPESPQKLEELRQAVTEKLTAGLLDEPFLAGVSAQLRQAGEKNGSPGLIALLQKVLQVYAGAELAQRSFATQADGTSNEAEQLLESLIAADEVMWEDLIRRGVSSGQGEVAESDLLKVVEKRMERMFIRTESGSYKQRVLGEFLRELEERTSAVVLALQSPAPPPGISNASQ